MADHWQLSRDFQAFRTDRLERLLAPLLPNYHHGTKHGKAGTPAPLHLPASRTMVSMDNKIQPRRIKPDSSWLNRQDIYGDTILMMAVQARCDAAVQLLVRAHADPSIVNNQNRNVLHLAALQAGLSASIATSLTKHAEAFLDHKDANGDTPLMLAIRTASTSMVNALLERKADINAQNDRLETATMLAARPLTAKSRVLPAFRANAHEYLKLLVGKRANQINAAD
ncbi:uncharacterized protein MONBRDRAFT_24515 [Monosiga brevicollis MX1]|uniref:Uncharacterized protein n=1 Tax=Monosiga brevicollis TaxID=81824 RepID=A9UWN3_MONBE|nr:uncharacterized protein MONBRDRAFT_24515 [Monosiga brevicollis MX1]EDQ90244.1 predicted protein [Monosiga brevicollis MX1]|eukprot:XP_001745011.1 hypothetical protein [Monosiga brevicollis MX1]